MTSFPAHPAALHTPVPASLTAEAGGLIPEFGVGQYEAGFEKAVFSLSKNGAITKPFKTSHGYHIVKRLGHVPVPSNITDEKTAFALKEKVEQSDRINSIKDVLAKSKGSSNPHNVVKATFDALLKMRAPHTVAHQRGVALTKVFNG